MKDADFRLGRYRRALLGWLILFELMLQVFPASADDTVRLGFLQGSRREMSYADARTAFDLWAQEMGARFQVPVKVLYYQNIAEMRRDFLLDKINSVTADSLTLARNFGLDELASGYSVVMQGPWNLELRTDPGVTDGNNLIGKRVALPQGDLVADIFLETLCLRRHARPCTEVFTEIQRLPNNNQAVMRLFFGKADLALVPRYGYELAREMNPQLERKAGKVVAELPLESMFHAFFSARTDKELRTRTLRMIPTMHTYPRGRQLLDLFKMDHLVLAEPSELKFFLQLDEEYRDLKARQLNMLARKAGQK